MHKFSGCKKGLQEGCPLSPKLFNLSVNNLFLTVEEAIPKPLCLDKNDRPISTLMYADDLITSSITKMFRCSTKIL